MKQGYLLILLVGLIGCFEGHDSLQEPPVGLGSEEPFLLAAEDGIYLSWMEPIDGDIHFNWNIKYKNYLLSIFKKKNRLKVVSFQITRCCTGHVIQKNFFKLSGRILSKKEMFVKFRGYPKKFNAWVSDVEYL